MTWTAQCNLLVNYYEPTNPLHLLRLAPPSVAVKVQALGFTRVLRFGPNCLYFWFLDSQSV